MCIYIYIYMRMCMCIYIYIYAYIHIYIYTHMYSMLDYIISCYIIARWSLYRSISYNSIAIVCTTT